MPKKFYSILLLTTILFSSLAVCAQDNAQTNQVEMADAMRSNGKIYVVVAVVVIILSGLFFYLIRLDRKVSRMEKEMKG